MESALLNGRSPRGEPVEAILLKGVRQNNLKGIDVSIPLGKLTVVTGLSGTGKSSLVFETLHAEGQRRYVETFSSYTRQFLDLLDKPDLDSVENIRPSIAIRQSNTVKTSRSTVGTMTELCDYFKVWFTHHAELFDPETGRKVVDERPEVIWEQLQAEGHLGREVMLLFRLTKPDNLDWAEVRESLLGQGYSRLWADRVLRIEEDADWAAAIEGTSRIEVIQDRLALSEKDYPRFLESADHAMHFGGGELRVVVPDGVLLGHFSRGLHSPETGRVFKPKSPALFSFNNPIGACPRCRGFGRVIEVDYNLVFPDKRLSLKDGVIRPFSGEVYQESLQDLLRACKRKGIPANVPWMDMQPEHREFVIEGEPGYQVGDFEKKGSWYGVKGFFDFLQANTYKMHVRVFLSRYRSYVRCPDCGGARFNAESRNWKWNGLGLADLFAMPVGDLEALIREQTEPVGNPQVDTAREGILTRLHYLVEVGLGYLTLDRSSRSLSGGEVERVNLTACLGTQLTDTLFVLDEPSVGLHSRDIGRLIRILRRLTDMGNTVVVVEHDESVMEAADHIIEMGPRPGNGGGRVVYAGTVDGIRKKDDSPTGRFLSGAEGYADGSRHRVVSLAQTGSIAVNGKETGSGPVPEGFVGVERASMHNIRELSIRLPLQRLVCITGVSGSGKSTLLNHVIHQGLLQLKGQSVDEVAMMAGIEITDPALEVVFVDQSAVSRTPRSNPALFTGAWDAIRKLFASTPSATGAGFTASEFSFNSGEGRCPHCQGLGYEQIEMQFLSDVFVKCPVCEGKRFKPEVLEIVWNDKSIADVLEMDIDRAIGFFRSRPAIVACLKPLAEVGLGYLQMGQAMNTLSGGESQRLKVVRAIQEADSRAGKCLLLLDEPTTGLHRQDVQQLLAVFQRIVEMGHSIMVIEHHLDVIRASDWVVEMGPDAGKDGGRIIAEGAPQWIASLDTPTGVALRAEQMGDFRDPVLLKVAEERVPVLRSPNLQIRGAREHNLRNLSLEIPSRSITVLTGVSGSGKSTLAFDIIFAEGQRRFMESMSSYARQFVEQLPRPDLDDLRGISPTVAIEQRVTRGTRKSTVATITEVAQYLRLLYARIGVQHSLKTGEPLVAMSPHEVGLRASAFAGNWQKESGASGSASLFLCVPVIRGRKGHHQPLATWAIEHGHEWIRCDGELVRLDAFRKLDRYREHDVEVIPSVLRADSGSTGLETFSEAFGEALKLGKGVFFMVDDTSRVVATFSTRRVDPVSGMSYPDLDPKHFSWNSSRGWCETCRGHGKVYRWLVEEEQAPAWIASLPDGSVCPDCHGDRLNPISRNVRLPFIDGSNASLPELLRLNPRDLLARLKDVALDDRGRAIMTDIYPQIVERLAFMAQVGIEYLTLDRETLKLSGGESQRIRLASQLGTHLTGVLYVLDEPSIGLHPRDNQRLIDSLIRLRDKGNTLVVVEHDEDTMRQADHIIDLGPGAGSQGGRILAQGTLQEVLASPDSITGRYLGKGITHPMRGSYRELPPDWSPRRKLKDPDWLVMTGAGLRNLRGQDLRIPLGRLTMVCGVSGAGKSTLIRDLLMPAVGLAIRESSSRIQGKDCVSAQLYVEDGYTAGSRDAPFKTLHNGDVFSKVIEIDQNPIGKTPRSIPATYIGVFDTIREIFASAPEAKVKGYQAGTFSFNTAGGRCEVCNGAGRVKLEMSFMPDAWVECDACRGQRFRDEVLDIRWRGMNIADVLGMSFNKARDFFSFNSGLSEVFQLMVDTGLGYLKLGQISPTLSGGEAQRVKMVSELVNGIPAWRDRVRGVRGRNLYVLEEPTIGLHASDCERLIGLLHKLVEQGHTVIVIEHNVDLLAEADYVVEVGPGSAAEGGSILYQGALAGLKDCPDSPTAPFCFR